MTDQNANASEINTGNTNEASAVETQKVLTPQGIEIIPLETVGAIDATALTINKPASGQTADIALQPGQKYIFDFSENDMEAFSQDGDTLTITFSDSATLTISNISATTTTDSRAFLVFSDDASASVIEVVETVPSQDELEDPQADLRERAEDIQAAEQAAEEAAQIQPAAGDQTPQQLAQIEPAAGDTAGQGGAENSGFSYEDPTITPVGPLSAVGPINPTALQYGVDYNNETLYPEDEFEDFGPTDIIPEVVDPDALNFDETNLGPIVQNGQILAQFGSDGPGTITPNGTYNVTGSVAGGTLTSNGTPVTIAPTVNGYEGTAGGNQIFTLEIDPDTGDFTFTLTGVIDHADGTNPNDVITFEFGVAATDNDNDVSDATITVHVADDAPSAPAPETISADEDNLGPIVINDSLTIDFGNDGAGAVSPDGATSFTGATALTSGGQTVTIAQTATGYEGTINGGTQTVFALTIDPANGDYTYTQNLPLDHDGTGTDTITVNFGVEVQDYDTDTANSTISVEIVDSVPKFGDQPTIGKGVENVDESNLPAGSTASGTLNVDTGADTPVTIKPTGTPDVTGSVAGTELTSGGETVTITTTTNGYTATINGGADTVFTLTIDNNGDYTFTQSLPLDHADTADHNDIITLTFGVEVEDSDGDTDTGTITINVADDGPVAVDDGATVLEKTTTVNGNVTTNDDGGEDTPATVTNVNYDGTDYPVIAGTPTVINAEYGTLTLNSNGSYEYVINGTHTGAVQDDFTYTLTDFDGDTDTAKLTVSIDAPDDKPKLSNASAKVDETDIDAIPAGSDVDTGTLTADFGTDGPGTFELTGVSSISFTGAEGDALTSNGSPVIISTSGNTYVGAANGMDIFTLSVDENTGEYTFTLNGPLDHADETNPDDVIQITFGVTARDNEDDIGTADIVVDILDDGPSIAAPTVLSSKEADLTTAPIVLDGTLTHDFGEDGAGEITPTGSSSFTGVSALTSEGQEITITQTATGYVGTIAGGAVAFDLSVNPATGAYSFTQYAPLDHAPNSNELFLNFGVQIKDFDADTATTDIQIKVKDSTPEINNDQPTAGKGLETVDESNLPGGSTASGQIDVNFGADTPGTLATNGVTSTSTALTSAGNAVTIAQTATGYAGTINGGADTVFTLTVNASGEYTFTQMMPLDHPDASNPNDAITINFGVVATDYDGDTDTGNITINVLDDAPVAHDDFNMYDTTNGGASGNVITGENGGAGAADELSKDDAADEAHDHDVIEISFKGNTVAVPEGGSASIEGDNGTLTINDDGSYTYTLKPGVATSDIGAPLNFAETLEFPELVEGTAISGDTLNNLGINAGALDFNQPVQGSVNFVSEGAGYNNTLGSYTVAADGSILPASIITENGNAATPADGLNYSATDGQTLGFFIIADGYDVNSSYNNIDFDNGELAFIYKFGTADERPANINDNGADLSLVFTDGTTNLQTALQGPIYHTTTRGGSENLNADSTVRVVSGLADENDPTTLRIGFEDLPNLGDKDYEDIVFDITMNPVIDCIMDEFGYVLRDGDGDTSNATLELCGKDMTDDTPILSTPKPLKVDETDLAPVDTDSDQVTADFKTDGPGTFSATGDSTFGFSGAKGGALTSEGNPVTVTKVSDTLYRGATATETIFELAINKTTGEYDFTLMGTLDHADAGNPDDVIQLSFGVTATDKDGDTDDEVILVNVHDDAPNAEDDSVTFGQEEVSVSGDVTANDEASQDKANTVTKIAFGSNVVDVPTTGTASIDGEFGTLEIKADGTYTYTIDPSVANASRGEVLNLDPTANDVAGDSDTLTKNGITVKGTNSTNNDLAWVSEDGAGIGIAGGSDKVYPYGEKLEVSFPDAEKVIFTIADIGANDLNKGLDFKLHFTDGSSADFEFDLGTVTPVNGIIQVELDSAEFGGKQFEQIDIDSVYNSSLGKTSFLLNDVQVITPDCGCDTSDQFEYTYTDGDLDSDTALLTLNSECPPAPVFIVGENVDDVADEITPWAVGSDNGEITGQGGADILVGDVGGAKQIDQTQDYNFVYILDISKSMGKNCDDDEITKVEILIEAVKGLMRDFDNYQGGHIKTHVVAFSSGVHSAMTFDFADADALTNALGYLESLSGEGYTNYEAPMQNALSWLSSDQPIGGDAITETYFISDGEPNHYVNDHGYPIPAPGDYLLQRAIIMAELTGTSITIGGYTFGDTTNEIDALKSYGEVHAVGIDVPKNDILDAIDTSDEATYLRNPNDLDVVLTGKNPLHKLAETGNDTIIGNESTDLIYGDALYTDDLADAQGLSTLDGEGWKVFERLENGEGNDAGWTREDTLSYIRNNAEDLAAETRSAQGEARNGGDDTIDGGLGDDLIFGQEGNDRIAGGAGDDTLYGGSGEDSFVFTSTEHGVDTIKDFNASEDTLDVSALLQGYDALQDSIEDFVFKTEAGGNTKISVDADGQGGQSVIVDIAVLESVTGLSIEDITNNGESTL